MTAASDERVVRVDEKSWTPDGQPTCTWAAVSVPPRRTWRCPSYSIMLIGARAAAKQRPVKVRRISPARLHCATRAAAIGLIVNIVNIGSVFDQCCASSTPEGVLFASRDLRKLAGARGSPGPSILHDSHSHAAAAFPTDRGISERAFIREWPFRASRPLEKVTGDAHCQSTGDVVPR